MQVVRCLLHAEKFVLPIEDKEYLLGKYHDNVVALCKHREIHGDCKFEVVLG